MLGLRQIALRSQRNPACGIEVPCAVKSTVLVFDRDISGHLLSDGNSQSSGRVHDLNAAIDGRTAVGTLNSNGCEFIARTLQIHALGADRSNRLRLDARRLGLGDGTGWRGQDHAVSSCKQAIRLHVSCGGKRDIAARRGHIAADGHVAACGSEIHIPASCQSRSRLLRQIAQCRQGNRACGREVSLVGKGAVLAKVSDRDISVHRRSDGNGQGIGRVHDRNAAIDGRTAVGTLNSNGCEFIACTLQVHAHGADSSNRLGLDARRFGLGDGTAC